MRRRRGPAAAAGDAAVIESSWREPERFAVLFDRHAPHIYRYLARRAGRQVADDLVAETFLAAFAKRDRYDLGHADARPWLYGIATNLVGQHRRDEARQYRIRQAAVAEPEVPGHAERVAADVTAQAVLSTALFGLATLELIGNHGVAQVLCAALTWLTGLAAVWMLWRPASSVFFNRRRQAAVTQQP